MSSLNDMLYDVKRIAQHRVELTDEKIESIYEQLMKDLDAFLAEGYRKYADSDGRLYLNYLDEHRQMAAFLQQVVDNVDNISPALKDQMQELIEATYEECYRSMANSVKAAYSGEEVAMLLDDIEVNPRTLEYSVNNNISKLTLPAVLEAHRAQIIYQIQQELNIGLLNGDRYETMADRISERVGEGKRKAMNISRTETHRNVEAGFMDCAEHIQEGMNGSGYIFAATWRTMKDERVRPQQRRKTKSGWRTTWSKNGANHVNMEGQTVEVGERFRFSDGVRTKAPGLSGTARHDCQCRCFIEYNLMTEKEFSKAAGRSPKYDNIHYNTSVRKEPKITSDLQEAVSGTGGELSGLDFRLKTKDSFTRKVEKEMIDLNKKASLQGLDYKATQKDAVANMRDVVRYTSLSPADTLTDDYFAITESLKNKGYSVVRVKNTFTKDSEYKGINIILRDMTGYEFELQFHTPQSFDLKNGILHELYEEQRLVTTTAERKAELAKQMKEISDSIILPDNVQKIASFNTLSDAIDKYKNV